MPLSRLKLKTEHLYRAIGGKAGTAIVAVLWMATGLCGTATAATPPSSPPFLKMLVAAGKIKLLRSFATGKPGLTGYVVQRDGRNRVVFGEEGYLIAGHLFSPQGEDLVARYSDQYLPKPDVASTVKQLENAGHLIVQGPPNAPVLYVFADPNCIFCHRFYGMAEPLVRAGRLQLRWAIVGFLKPSSAGRATAILSASNPVQALQTNDMHFDVNAEEGGMPPAPAPDGKLQALLEAHFAAMQSAGGSGTPTLLYRTDANHWVAQVGLPSVAWLDRYAAVKNAAAGAAR